jgi:glutamate racemase
MPARPMATGPSEDIVELTREGVETLFELGCPLVMLACNTATAVSRPADCSAIGFLLSRWADGAHNVIGIIAPTVEAATQTPWAVTAPQYPQKYNSDTIAVFATTPNRRLRRLPRGDPQALPEGDGRAADLSELGRHDREGPTPEPELDAQVAELRCASCLAACGGVPPHRAILGCTHYVRSSSTSSAVICRPSRACCRSPRSSPTASRTI